MDALDWILLAALLVGAASAGCLGDTAVDTADEDAPPSPPQEGAMTAQSSTSTSEGVAVGAPRFAAWRTIEVEGRIDLTSLPVNLSADRGEIEVVTGPAGEWGARIQVTGYGATPEEARRERGEVSVNWSIGEPGHRRLRIAASQPEDASRTGRAETSIRVTVPERLALTLETSLEEGNVTVEGVRTPVAVLGVADGGVDADLRGTRRVTVGVSNGGVTATVHPTRSGTITASAANGQVRLRVPEDADHGYRARASTSNGDATIALEDGSKSESAGAAGDQVRFVTTGYEDRPVRTQVTASTSNGDVVVGPT